MGRAGADHPTPRSRAGYERLLSVAGPRRARHLGEDPGAASCRIGGRHLRELAGTAHFGRSRRRSGPPSASAHDFSATGSRRTTHTASQHSGLRSGPASRAPASRSIRDSRQTAGRAAPVKRTSAGVFAQQRPRARAGRRAGRSRLAAEQPLQLPRIRGGLDQRARPRRGAAGGRRRSPAVQPALPLRRCRPWQKPPPACDRVVHPRPRAGASRPLPLRRTVHVPVRSVDPEKGHGGVQGATPLRRCAADRRHSVHLRPRTARRRNFFTRSTRYSTTVAKW